MSVRLRRFWIQLTSDRRRFGVLCAVLATGLLLWARIIIVSNMPRTAVANPPTGPGPTTGAKNPIKPTNSPVRGTRTSTEVKLATIPDRDPFVISQIYFPKPTPVLALAPDPAKLPPDQAEELQQIESRRTAVLQVSVAELQLDAAMEGLMAMISGKAYRQGDAVAAPGNEQVQFVLVEVKQRSVILECEGRRFELRMATP